MNPSRVNRGFVDTQSNGCCRDQLLCVWHGEGRNDHQVHETAVSKCGGNHSLRDCLAHVTPRKDNGKKSKPSKSWSKSAGKGKSIEDKGDRKSKGSKNAKGSYNGTSSKTGLSGLENRNQRQVKKHRKLRRRTTLTILTLTILSLMMAGVVTSGLLTGARLAGMQVWKKLCDSSQAHSLWGSFDLGAACSPKRFGWVTMNLDTGAAVNTFPLNFGPDGAGCGIFHRTASCGCIPDGGAWQFQGYDENGQSETVASLAQAILHLEQLVQQ